MQILNRVLNKQFSIVQNSENGICSFQEHKHKVGFDLLSAAFFSSVSAGSLRNFSSLDPNEQTLITTANHFHFNSTCLVIKEHMQDITFGEDSENTL